MFTQRHYVVIAGVISDSWKSSRSGESADIVSAIDESHSRLVSNFMEAFTKDNDRFNAAKFVRAATPVEAYAAEVNAPIEGSNVFASHEGD